MRFLAVPLTFALAVTGCSDDPKTPNKDEKATSQPNKAAAQMRVDELDAKASAALLKSKPEIKVLDIRTPKEFAVGHLPGAMMVDYKAKDFADKLGKLDKSATYLIH